LFEFVRALKTFSSRRINEFRNSPGTPVWQSRFHDRIVRDENELNRIREYIKNNPINWETDDLNMEVAP
jgi:REP element-mobilizing transposase RayT